MKAEKGGSVTSSVDLRRLNAQLSVPYFRPSLAEAEIGEVVNTLRSGWMTTGPKVKRFETEFAQAIGAPHAVAVNSCTAALHLAVEALGLRPGQGVLVPTMTFAATAEVVRYLGGIPILVDCDPQTLNLSLDDATRKLKKFRQGNLVDGSRVGVSVAGIIPVHVGGLMMDVEALQRFADRNDVWLVEDAAHAFPASWRQDASAAWQRCGEANRRRHLLLFLCQQDDYDGRGRNGGHA